MKKHFTKLTIICAAIAMLAAVCTSCNNSGKVKLKNECDSVSWAVGENTALGLKNMPYDFNVKVVLQAIQHTLDGKEQPLSDEAYQKLLNNLMSQMNRQMQEDAAKEQEQVNVKEQQIFSELCAKDQSIQQAEGGYYYKVIKSGHGPNVKRGEVAVFDYKGYILPSMELIDQTYGVRDPIETIVGGNMFSGLQMGLTQMNAGSIIQFYFPSALAFGKDGTQDIPSNTPISYVVEMHSFHK